MAQDEGSVLRGPTLGESRVRMDFNVSGDEKVAQIKRLAADFIDLCESLKESYNGQPNEKNRCLAVAQTEAEAAAMWAVKGATGK